MTAINYGLVRVLDKIINQRYPNQQKFDKNEVVDLINQLEKAIEYVQPGNKRSTQFRLFEYFVEHCFYRNLAAYDSMVLITSDKGMGKSSFAMMLAKAWCQILGKPFSPKRHIAYNNKDLMDKIDQLEYFEPIICDESVRFVSSEDWNKRENKELKKKLAQVRTKHLFYIMCFPLKIYKVEKTYLESFVNYWIEIIDRGVGSLFVKDKNPYQDSWRLSNFKYMGAWTEFTDVKNVEKRLKKHPNFWQIIRARKPPKQLEDSYLKVREQNVYQDDSVWSSTTKNDIINAILVKVLKDFITSDSTLNWKRIILHIQNEYGLTIPKKRIDDILKESEQVVNKAKDTGVKV